MLRLPPDIVARIRASDHHIIVTGAGGWLGMATLEMLDAAFEDDLTRRVSAYASSQRPMELSSGRTITVSALEDLTHQAPRPTYVFHYAYLGKEKVAELGVDRFLATNEKINALVENFCVKIPQGGMYFASSGAANFAKGSTEDAAREPYGSSKIRDEKRFKRLANENFPVTVCRIFNMAGPCMNKLNEYALGSILVDIENGGPIKIRANRPVVRSYVHVRDVLTVAFETVLDANPPVKPFDAAGLQAIEIGALASRAKNLLGQTTICIERPPLVTESEDRYLGDGTLFNDLLVKAGRQPASLDEQILDTATYLRNQKCR